MTDDQLKPLSEEIELIKAKIRNRNEQIQLLNVQQTADSKHLEVLEKGLAKLSGKTE